MFAYPCFQSIYARMLALYVCTYICIYSFMHSYKSKYTNRFIHAHTYACIHLWVYMQPQYIFPKSRPYTHVNLYECTYIANAYAHVHRNKNTYIHNYIHTLEPHMLQVLHPRPHLRTYTSICICMTTFVALAFLERVGVCTFKVYAHVSILLCLRVPESAHV